MKSMITEVQTQRIAESKTILAEYLAVHPLTWTDGNQYGVTQEKQFLLTSQLVLYAADNTYILHWNSCGSICTEWTIEALTSLAKSISAYVQPFVSYQQTKEIEICNCTTMEEVETIVIDYDSIKG